MVSISNWSIGCRRYLAGRSIRFIPDPRTDGPGGLTLGGGGGALACTFAGEEALTVVEDAANRLRKIHIKTTDQ